MSVFFLYRFQYSAAILDGVIYEEDLYETLIFRVFFASSDALRLWIDYFGINGEGMGLSVIGSICGYLGECFNPNTYIPYYYLNREQTSMQVGFMGTALGVGGFMMLPVMSILFAMVVVFNSWVLSRVQSNRSAIFMFLCPVMFINSFFLTTRELHTASLSGGAIFTSLIIIVLFRKEVGNVDIRKK